MTDETLKEKKWKKLTEDLGALGLSDDSSQTADDSSLIQHCSFCAKSQDDVAILIAGPGVNICNECVDLTNEILREGDFSGHPSAKCSFCGQAQEQSDTRRVIGARIYGYLCDECVGLCNEIIADHYREKHQLGDHS